jgi:large subunit ribosomal protein L15
MLDKLYADGEMVSLKTLQEKGFAPRRVEGGLKILSNGELTKKVTIEAAAYSAAAQDKLTQMGIAYKVVE